MYGCDCELSIGHVSTHNPWVGMFMAGRHKASVGIQGDADGCSLCYLCMYLRHKRLGGGDDGEDFILALKKMYRQLG